MLDILQYHRKIEKTIKIKLAMQDGDVLNTWAYITPIENDYGYKPDLNIESRLKILVNLFDKYHQ